MAPERASMRMSPYMEPGVMIGVIRFLAPRGLEQTDCGVTAHVHYKEKAYSTRIDRLESCEGSDVTGASSQGVEANRCVAFSHSRGAVGWCQ